MPDEIRITITKGGQVVDSVGLAFATREEMPLLPIDALDALVASAAWHLVTSLPEEFTANDDGTVRWWWANPAFNPEAKESAENRRHLFADLTAERCVSVVLRKYGEKIIAGRNQAIARYQASQQAAAGSELIAGAVTVTE